MGMEAHSYIGCKVIIHQIEHSQEVVLIHGSQCIHQIECEGVHGVDLFDKVKEGFISIGSGSNGLNEHLIALIGEPICKVKGSVDILLVECETYA